jgi:hypothetical protein
MQRARGGRATADRSAAGSKPQAGGQTGRGEIGEDRRPASTGAVIRDDTQ